jgi:hypothetical protein
MVRIRRDKFTTGVFWELYTDLERQFENFLEYVPYLEGNKNIYSFKLVNLILGIGGHVDSAFKEMVRYPLFSKNKDCEQILSILKENEEQVKKGKGAKTIPIQLFLRAFEEEYKLSRQIVLFRCLPHGEVINPFKPFNPRTKAPEWWETYNGLKHDVSINLEKASLQNTRNALACAFLLNACHIPSAYRFCQYGLLHGIDIPSPITFLKILERKQGYPVFLKTPLFMYNYDK